jgi:hypothetical protein
MNNRLSSSESVAYPARGKTARWPTMCPCCGVQATRVERRWADLLLSLAVPVRRYRCTVARCSWQGLVRYD